ncbi:hypothetical protein [Bogoriella caseilytica]|uniref:DUF3137 domain-containing protein n=1 Tax=Bogoriella caseilytica TaxID=56055 RepID=A0A3N2BGM9_9MICO|nr:hypothetical protein [Bogoriella caseilytica]ROR74411.1 hypothetical protein EDD31_2826 [Bogoriella caseilytica]
MDSPAMWLFIAVAAVALLVPGLVAVGLIVLVALRGRRTPRAVRERYRHMEQWARSVGWRYCGTCTWHETLRGGPFTDPENLGHAGTAPRSDGAARGTFGSFDAAAWDYSERYKSDARPRRRWHIVAITLPAALPPMEMRQAPTDPRPGMSFEDEEFNASWRVTARDPRTAYGIANPQMIERLKRADTQGCNLLIHGNQLVLWREGLIDPPSTERALRLLVELFALIPRHVWDDANTR